MPWLNGRNWGSSSKGAGGDALDTAVMRRFMPEAMRGADAGTLIMQQGCGTIAGPESQPFRLALLSCRFRWFSKQERGHA